jgi:glutamate-5-semialdehyde dehydrogenase
MTGSVTPSITEMGRQARLAAASLVSCSSNQINDFLETLAKLLEEKSSLVLEANQLDVTQAKSDNKLDAYIDRLTLNPDRLQNIAQSARDIAALPDPVGRLLDEKTRPNGLKISKISVPIGVLGMIYESRPNVTIDAACLALKSRNAIILRGGSDCLRTNMALANLIEDALQANNLPANAAQLVTSTDRALVGEMLTATDYIDVMIPRGGKSLTERVMREARMPVFAHLDGNCHIYVQGPVDPDMAVDVIVNAKLRRTGVCGAAESLLFHADLDEMLKSQIIKALLDQGCAVRGDDETQKLDQRIEAATQQDWQTEYLDACISVAHVPDVAAAVSHINQYGSHHTDAILTDDMQAADYFTRFVDSAIVIHNASTQFADGGEFGMGAEIGIGTGKLHARGPVGLEQLTTFKYVVSGSGQTRPA